MAISMRQQLHPLFMAEVEGIDLRRALDLDIVAALVAALDRYAVLVFPGQDIDDEQQLAFGRSSARSRARHSPY